MSISKQNDVHIKMALTQASTIGTIIAGGTDVSDTTATAGDVIAGKVFHLANGSRAVGTIATVTQPNPTPSFNSSTGLVTATYTPVSGVVSDTTAKSGTLQLPVQAAQTITPGTSNKTIASGKYLTGTQTILGDADLVASNIKKNVNIFGVTGTYEGGGGGGGNFYKCASVSSGTWTGYKAVQDSTTKIWSFESSLTSDTLTYGTGFTPSVNSIYNADATAFIGSLYVGIPIAGMVLYAPLSSNQPTAATGQSITTYGTVTYGVYQGIPSVTVQDGGESHLTIGNDNVPVQSDMSISIWLQGYGISPFGLGVDGYTRRIWFMMSDNLLKDYGYGADSEIQTNASSGSNWFHVVYVIDVDGDCSIYINGSLAGNGSGDHARNPGSGNIGIGWIPCAGDSRPNNPVRASSLRIYNRLLTSSEIASLYSEFTPTN